MSWRVQRLFLFFLDPPTKGPYSAIVRVLEGTQETLSCPVDGRPEPNITWYEGNDTTSEVQHQGRNWTIRAESNDTGWYSCSAKNFLNLFKPVNVSFHLIVGKFSCLLIILLGNKDAFSTQSTQMFVLQVIQPFR